MRACVPATLACVTFLAFPALHTDTPMHTHLTRTLSSCLLQPQSSSHSCESGCSGGDSGSTYEHDTCGLHWGLGAERGRQMTRLAKPQKRVISMMTG